MAGADITSKNELGDWLNDKPADWAQVIALRAAMRALPYISISGILWTSKFALLPFGALITSWMQIVYPSDFIRTDASRANGRFGGIFFDSEGYNRERIPSLSANSSYHSADAQSRSMHLVTDCLKAVEQASEVFWSVFIKVGRSAGMGDWNFQLFWNSIAIDAHRLEHLNSQTASKEVARETLWKQSAPSWTEVCDQLYDQLTAIDPNYSVWIDWYERRIRGERAAFDIPGDKRRVEDKKILRRLAEATDEDFWSKGHEYVNATLKGWLDEARARVAPPPLGDQQPEAENLREIEVPPPVSGATAYGLNGEGKLDPLPHYDQQHLRDLPDQRQAYADMREAALELNQEGQRLGPKLLPKLGRFIDAAPERFDDAKAWPIWSAATALRTLYWKHKAVAENPEPDDAKLDPAVAVDLRGFLDIYNVFAFGDDGLRQKDENSISPQERLKTEEQAKLSQPIQKAIVDTVAIRTEATLEEIQENQDNVTLTSGTPYADQALDQANKTTQSLVVGLMNGAKSVLTNPEVVGAELAKLGIKGAAAGVATYAIFSPAASMDFAALIEFIAVNAEPLKAYVVTIYQSYTHLPDMIDRLKALWAKRRN
jgi:hypothetical protein